MISRKNYSDQCDEYIRVNHDKPAERSVKIEHDRADGLSSNEDKNYNHEESDYFNIEKYDKKVTGAGNTKYFCVFRAGKKYKNLGMIKGFEKHMERDIIVPNADPEMSKYNQIIIGNGNVTDIVRDYIAGINLRSNANIARDLVLTTSHDFFKDLPPQEREKWIQENIKFLRDNFGDNCVYACVHMDETTPHIHALIVPKFYNEEKKVFQLRSNVYFDGIQKMQNWQTQYANYMSSKFSNLIRGVKGSKAKHVDIRTYYNLLSKKFDVMDGRQIESIAKRNFLLEKRTKALEFTLAKMNENGDTENLLKRLNKLEKSNKEYKEITKAIIKKYGLKEKEIFELIDKVQSSNKNERERK